MTLLSSISFALPLADPVLKFLIILLIILAAPLILNRLKIPHILGLIIAGAIIGPNGFNLLLRDSGIILSGTAGLLYIMFLAGLEMDLGDFKKNSGKSLTFGLYTFSIPMVLGTFAGYFLLGFSWPTSLLLASMFASHTLITYPIVSKMGITKNPAVSIAVGGTMITDTLALLILTIIVSVTTGQDDMAFWLQLGLSTILFGLIVLFVFPIVCRWFFKHVNDAISQYIFVLSILFLGAFLAQLASMEAIIGAFLTGLALNRLISKSSPLMNRVEFMGNAIFIPFFLLSVGMLIDYKVFFTDIETIKAGVVMIVVATLAKYMAAWATQKTFRLSKDQRFIIFGLSNAQAAATLAAVMVGYNVILGTDANGEPIRLLNESVLNGAILMIFVTCIIASVYTQRGAKNIVIKESSGEVEPPTGKREEGILIPVSNENTVEELVLLSLAIKSTKNIRRLYALTVIDTHETDTKSVKRARRIVDKAVGVAAAADMRLKGLIRSDLNVPHAISSVVRERDITDLIIGLHQPDSVSVAFVGNVVNHILDYSNVNTYIYKPVQPLGTVGRNLVFLPESAEKELGFFRFLKKLYNVQQSSGVEVRFYGSEATLSKVKEFFKTRSGEVSYTLFSDWNDTAILGRDVKTDDCVWVMLSRKGGVSYNSAMPRVPEYFSSKFQKNSFIIVYPTQV